MSTVEKIAALLTMAERTNNSHEADAFLKKAQQLATNASVDLAMARSRTARKELREQPIIKTVAVGELRKRSNKHLIELFIGLATANDVKVDIAHNSTYVIAYGMPSDIEVVEILFSSLATQMFSSAEQWLRTGEWRNDKYLHSFVHTKLGGVKPVHKLHTAQTARGAFNSAFTKRVTKRVKDSRNETIAERTAAEKESSKHADSSRPSTGSELLSTAVVLRDKEKEVGDFHKSQSRARGSWTGYSGAGAGSSGGRASAAGKAAGDRARIGSQSGLSAGGGSLSQ